MKLRTETRRQSNETESFSGSYSKMSSRKSCWYMGLDEKMDLKSRTLMIHCLYYFRTQEELLVHLPLQMKGAKKRGRRDTNTDLRNLRFFSGCHFLSTSPLPPHSHARRMDRNFYSLGCRFCRLYLAIISYALR